MTFHIVCENSEQMVRPFSETVSIVWREVRT